MIATRRGRTVRALAIREQTHRRWILLATGSLLLLSTTPVFGHHLVAPGALLAGVDHLGAICMTALHLLLAPVHRVFHVIILSGVAYAVLDRLRAWRLQRRVLDALDANPPQPGDPFWIAAHAAGLDPTRVRVVSGLPNPAFSVGFLRPRVFVARALPQHLSTEQFVAVLAHERAHIDRRDPLRLSLLRALACTLFWLPALRRLSDDLADEAEILADDVAAAERPLALASAILLLAQWPSPRVAGSVSFSKPDLLDRRIRRLVGEVTEATTHVTRRSVFSALAALALVWSSGTMMIHPQGAESMHSPVHCEHHDGSPFTHLFCLGSLSTASRACPHEDD